MKYLIIILFLSILTGSIVLTDKDDATKSQTPTPNPKKRGQEFYYSSVDSTLSIKLYRGDYNAEKGYKYMMTIHRLTDDGDSVKVLQELGLFSTQNFSLDTVFTKNFKSK